MKAENRIKLRAFKRLANNQIDQFEEPVLRSNASARKSYWEQCGYEVKTI